MNIVFFTRFFYPHIGGVEKHVLKVSEELIKHHHHVRIFTEQYDTTLPLVETYRNIAIYRIPVSNLEKKKKYDIWNYLYSHRKIIKNADIIHVHDVFFWYFPFRFMYLSKKVFTTFHGYETSFPLSKKAVIIRRISNFLSHGSVNIGKFIEKWYGTNPTFVTYGGVDIRKNANNLPKKIPVKGAKNKKQNKKLKIVFVGRIEEDTGVSLYAKVLETLRGNGVPFEFGAVGNGTKKNTLSRFGEIKGLVKKPEKYIHGADIVFTSSYLTMLESLAYKKLVIAVFDNPLKEDYIKTSPFSKFVISGNNPRLISERIGRYIKDPGIYKSKIENGFFWTQERTWEKVANIYIKLWKK